ncbi:hypothetical protein BDF20DRAFT_879626 [Mycotypha africana]|uniref:uncharacterized protein n=1 Tax=Mycotypha africana TaxID=64632 RepID=UPI002300A1F3|nr:uncharacterized protein BDF20DRAFT_879626 [Mycotypha africana]KAI8975612.1 hypothetical protein BDF20DRAFT_879626 [Mycotypha africana]
MRAFTVLFNYIQAYPRHAYKYLINAINLLILCAQGAKGEERQKCITLLVTELFPRLCKQRLLLVRKEKVPSIKSTDSKHYITLPYNLFEQFLLLGQRFYIKKHQWKEATRFTCHMLAACGYTNLDQLADNVSYVIRFQYLKEHRKQVRIDDDDNDGQNREQFTLPVSEDLSILSTFMCECMVAASQFVEFGYRYYKYVCGTDDVSSSTSDQKTCLIPLCSFQPNNNNNDDNNDNDGKTDATVRRREREYEDDDSTGNTLLQHSSNKRQRLMDSSSLAVSALPNGTKSQQDVIEVELEAEAEAGAQYELEGRARGLDSFCLQGVDEALQILGKAGDCLRHVVELWNWAYSTISQKSLLDTLGGWEEEFCRIVDGYRLPFDMHNAVLLIRSDLALSSPSVPGNLAKALELSQTICDRIEVHRRQEKTEPNRSSKASSATSSSLSNPITSKLSTDMDIPFMFAFRVLYNIGIIYLLVGSLQQSTLEIAIILSVFPIPSGLSADDFVADEADCCTVANIFQGREFGLMKVTQEGLVVRCIKHLIVSLDNESEQRSGMASIDSALRWDEKAGNMIVLMQYGWPYWSTRTNLWDKIINRISGKRVYKNREFLEYLYVAEVLQTIRHLHLLGSVTMDIIPPEFALRNSYRHLVTTSSTSSTARATAKPNNNDNAEVTSTALSVKPLLKASSGSKTGTNGTEDEDDDEEDDNDDLKKSKSSSVISVYHPSFANSILPSTSMSPSWYSASTQKNSFAKWMSPSFYYSRPATSVVLPGQTTSSGLSGASTADQNIDSGSNNSHENGTNVTTESNSDTYAGDMLMMNGHNSSFQQIPSVHKSTTSFIPKDIVTRCLDYRIAKYSPKITPQRMRHVLQRFLKNMVLKANEDA